MGPQDPHPVGHECTQVRDYFTEAAQAILDGDDPLGDLSNALALVAGKVALSNTSPCAHLLYTHPPIPP